MSKKNSKKKKISQKDGQIKGQKKSYGIKVSSVQRTPSKPLKNEFESIPIINRVMEIGIIIVAFVTPLLFSIWSKNNFLLPKRTFAQSVLIILLGIYLIKAEEDGRFLIVKSDIWLPLAAFTGIALISLVHSISFYLSLIDLAQYLSYFFILFLTVNFIRTNRQKNRVFWVLVAVCFISSTYAVFQFYNIEFKFWARQGGRGNIFSTFGNPNRYSGFVGAVIPAMVGYFLVVKGIRKYILAITIPLSYTGVMMTFTRGALMGLGIASLVMLILLIGYLGYKVLFRYRLRIVYLLIVIAVITLTFSTENPINWSRFTVGERFASAVKGETSFVQRLMIWKISLMMVKDHPFIGEGVGTFKYHYLNYQGKYFENPAHKNDIHLAVWARESHNEYVEIAAEMGIIGLFIWLWLIFTFFRGRINSLKKKREEKKESQFIPQLGLTMGVLVILVHCVVSFPLHIAPNGLLLFLLMGLAIVA